MAAIDDIWFGPGLTPPDFQTFLHALSLCDPRRAPLLAVAFGENADARLVMASRALFGLFGVATAAALSQRLLQGHDPGSKRLAALCRMLPLEGAPRLERLHFDVGPGGEVITFLCRRIAMDIETSVFIAAALGVRPELLAAPVPEVEAAVPAPPDVLTPSGPEPAAAPTPIVSKAATSMSVSAIQATLRARWPWNRTMRFLWQTDQDGTCTTVSPPLADVVGAANADLVGRNLIDLAPQIDPSGRLGDALARRATWSGLDVAWPIADVPAGVSVGLGAIPAFDRDRGFEGYRGYGVVRLDRIIAREPARFTRQIAEAGSVAVQPDNVLPFPGKALSPEDQMAFRTLGAELRDRSGLGGTVLLEARRDEGQPAAIDDPVTLPEPGLTAPPAEPVGIVDSAATPGGATPIVAPNPRADLRDPPGSPSATEALAAPARTEEPAARVTEGAGATRTDDVVRNGGALLDRLAVGLLVSRNNVPIFANRHLLDMLGFADEDALHAAGMTHLFGDQPAAVTGSEAVGVRDGRGMIIAANARMQSIEWDGLPATLLTLQQTADDKPNIASSGDNPQSTVAAAAPLQDTRTSEDDARQDPSEAVELRAILETATDAVAVIDADCNVLSLNRSGEALFGCDRGAVIGKPFLNLFTADNQDLAADYFEGLKSNATRSLLNDGREMLVKTHRGGPISVFMTLGRLGASGATSSGATSGGARFCALFRDLTHWKKVEQELEGAKRTAERASALKSDFLAKVSHEVRTPLNAIIGFAEVIMDERFGPIGNERYKDYLRDIHASGTHVMSLVNDLLDLSKIEAGKMELAIEPIDANKIIGECVGLMQPQASRERVIMRLSLASSLPLIKADERSLRQIMLNLLSNAVKFNEPGGQVIVSTAKAESGQVVIRVRDTGPGMSDEDIKAALEPFRQLPTARSTTEASGTGLGLPLTKALVEANHAAFAIRSKIDQGTLAEVSFPPARVLAS